MAIKIPFSPQNKYLQKLVRITEKLASVKVLLCAITLIGTASWYAMYAQKRKQQAESRAEQLIWPIEQLLRTRQVFTTCPPELAKELVHFREAHPHTKAAQRAAIYLASLVHMPAKEYAQALQLLQGVKI